MQLPLKSIVLLILVAVVLSTVAAFFLLGIQLSPLDSRRVFSEGCISFCREIEAEALATGRRIDSIAIEKAESLAGSDFERACSQLYPDTRGYTYLCWNRNCCQFELPPP
jgi:hypothetical protein